MSSVLHCEPVKRLGLALTDSIGEQEDQLALKMEVERQRAEQDKSRHAALARLKALQVWPTAQHAKIRPDEQWSMYGVPLFLGVDEFVALFPGSDAKPDGWDRDGPNQIVGDIHVGHINGAYDRNRQVRALYGEQLEAWGGIVVSAGDTGPMVESRLGSPKFAGQPYMARNGETTWTYEYESTIVVVLFSQGVVRLIDVYDKSFAFSHLRC